MAYKQVVKYVFREGDFIYFPGSVSEKKQKKKKKIRNKKVKNKK